MSKPSQETLGEERRLWTDLQMAETLLFHAAAVTHPQAMHSLFDGIEAQGPARDLLIRAGSGFPAESLRPEDYLARYPFSNVGAIRGVFDELVNLGYTSRRPAGEYALTTQGVAAVQTWMDRVAGMMSGLDMGDVSAYDVEMLVQSDVQVIEALERSEPPHESPILRCRLQGIGPALDAVPALWHHWQHVWTILAASEDEEEAVRRDRGVDPLVWFIRRQLWFLDRRPWRARARTRDELVSRAIGYAPIEGPHAACAAALDALIEGGEVAEREGTLRLTETGLSACDQDEAEIDARLLARWPQWTPDEVGGLRDLLDRLIERLLDLIRNQKGGSPP